ncbi:ras-related and estrogen-regulated growth inhibitor-like protein isoform X1 [Hydra vulgaris]|uniref:ras-related and estrogen-regulated growth inhibitor-like protein isoform X1 n=1 Tax=Hydra vulgaris TaxID=6087 RepID=UPI001F5F6E96|nr:ras-related and estrogen-regulated growth inhibitor-like protein [Hydra vulgaris]XP_047126345.1 ras-related and estrogen-regulated growth inhibitor-like protein [Hydra vulgaris]
MSGLVIKLAVIGGKNSGKSALAVRFLTRRFIGEYDSNSDVCIKRNIKLAGISVELHIKDTAGSVWLKGPAALIGWSSVIVIVYSVTDTRSFSLAKYILNKINICKKIDKSSILLLGNKNDLAHLREISLNQGMKLAQKNGTHFAETSAANDYESVDKAFKKLLFMKVLAVSKIQTIEPVAFTRKLSLNGSNLSKKKKSKCLRRISVSSNCPSQESISSLSDNEIFEVIKTLNKTSLCKQNELISVKSKKVK